MDVASPMIQRGVTESQPYELQNALWAWARLQLRGEPLFAATGGQVAARTSESPAPNLAGTAWAAAALKIDGAPLLNAMSTAAHIKRFDARSLASLAQTPAESQAKDLALFKVFSGEAMLRAPQLNCQDPANITRAPAIMRLREEASPGVTSHHALAKVQGFKPPELASMAWALRKLDVVGVPLTEAAAACALPLMSSPNDQAAANTVRAFVTASSRRACPLGAVATAVEQRVAASDSQNLSMIA
ncbi:unnamed protein product [Effrenium voratum]|nr:unnamed protein product [Effrenium voratum]